jgi:predicted dehydrogenase
MRVLIAGLGSIGRRHLANLRSLEPGAEILVWRQHSHDAAVPTGADRVVFRIEDAIAWAPDAALLTGPSTTHIPAALPLAQAGVPLFIEKPISAALDGVDELIAVCQRRSLPLMVGYNLRFHEPLKILRDAVAGGAIGRILSVRAEVGQYLPDWRRGADYRQSVTARGDLGGGVVLELSHELDYARWIAGEVTSVSAFTGKLSDLEIDVEDTAEIILWFACGAIGSIHLDMVQRSPVRICRVIGTGGAIVWDGISGEVRIDCAGESKIVHPSGASDRNRMYREELVAFLQVVREGGAPVISGDDGRRTLQIALAAKLSARERRVIEVPQ